MSDLSNELTVRAIREAKMLSRTSETLNLRPEMINSPVEQNEIFEFLMFIILMNLFFLIPSPLIQ